MKISCSTLFDITATGITGHCKITKMPFTDKTGTLISNEIEWNRARNQQRNWETISQLLSLRTQTLNVSDPKFVNDRWCFDFEVETPDVFGDDLSLLTSDCNAVPMITGLSEVVDIDRVLESSGSDQNIWFDDISINK
jgi:hypothetical protein